MKKNKHIGSNFDDFLKEDGILEEVETRAIKRALVMEIEKIMEKRDLTKLRLAKQLRTSRSHLDRLLDPDNTSLTLSTMERIAHALGRRLEIQLKAA